MTDAARRASNWRRRLPGLTALNESTSARYSACDGQHVPSGETVRRSFPGMDRELKICARCGVPWGAPGPYYANSRGGKA